MISVSEVIVVEGRYDKNTLSQVVDATIVETGGFAVFNDKERLALIKKLAEKRGIIVFTDGDGAGFVIRNFLKGAIDKSLVKHAFVPDVLGKEKRKSSPSCEGKLGLEGMSPEVIIDALKKCGATINDVQSKRKAEITNAHFYSLGLSGGEGSAERRARLKKQLGLPERMSAKALLQAVSVLLTPDELACIVRTLDEDDADCRD